MAFPLRAIALAVFINFLWGGNIVAIKLGLVAVPPLLSAFWRFVIGVGALWVWARVNGIALRPQPGEGAKLALLAALFTVQIAAMNYGAHLSTSAMTSVLISTNPLFATVFAHLFVPGDHIRPRRAAGLLLAFSGIVVIFMQDPGDLVAPTFALGNLITLSSAAMLGGRLIVINRLVQHMDQAKVLFWQALLALPVFLGLGTLLEDVDWTQLGTVPIAGIVYQGLAVAGFAFMAAAWLLRNYSPSVVVSFNFISPCVGVLLSALILSERIGWNVLLGLGLVGLGLVLTTRR